MTSFLAFPRRGDSYTECFYPALESLGVTVHEGMFAGRWLLRHLRQVDYVHLHWPSFFYRNRSAWRCLRGFALFLFLLGLARLRRSRIIWTVHNLYPHDRCVVPGLDRLGRQILVRVAARFLVHGPTAEAAVLREFPAMAGRTIVIDHGHWIGHYPDRIDRTAARRRLGVAEAAYVFLFIGLCKPYKNLEGLIAAFGSMPADSILLVAGAFQDAAYADRVRTAVRSSGAADRIRMFPQFVPDEELQTYLEAADAVVAPYGEILTSGTAMLALSFGRPLVAPAKGFLVDVITAECGILYDPTQADGLAQAMLSARTQRFDATRIRAAAAVHDWRRSAALLLRGLGPARDGAPADRPGA